MTTPENRPPAAEERVAELTRDRACTRCGFNLSGQTIVREPHYGMLIVRCPECGTPAALQEYPALGRWGSRLGYAAAAVWLGFMILLVSGSAAAIWGNVSSISAKLAWPFTERVQRDWNQHAQAQYRATGAGWGGYNSMEEQNWWSALDKDKLFAELGGWWRGGIAWRGLWSLAEAAMILFPLGCLLAVCAPHLRVRGRLAMVALVVALGGAFSVLSWSSRNVMPWSYWGSFVGTEALSRLWPILMPLTLTACGGLFALGVWQGRRVARWTVRFLLSPRMRGPFSFLWHADGLPMPRPGR